MKIQNTNDLEEQGKDRGKDKLPGSRKITSRFPGKQHLFLGNSFPVGQRQGRWQG